MWWNLHCQKIVHGRSCPDVTIFRAEGKYVRGTTVVAASIEAPGAKTFEVIGGSLELKKAQVHQKANDSQEVLQTVANMIKVAGYLTQKALRKGKIIEEVKIYGLLVSHTNPFCLPFIYQSNCFNKSTTVHKGDEMLLVDALNRLLTYI